MKQLTLSQSQLGYKFDFVSHRLSLWGITLGATGKFFYGVGDGLDSLPPDNPAHFLT